jgi:hypothetical protein
MANTSTIIQQIKAADLSGTSALTSLRTSGDAASYEKVVTGCLGEGALPLSNKPFWDEIAVGLGARSLPTDTKRSVVEALSQRIINGHQMKPEFDKDYVHVPQIFPLLIDLLDEAESASNPGAFRSEILIFIMSRCFYPLYGRAMEPKLAKFIEFFKIGQRQSDHGPDSHFSDLIACLSGFTACEDILPTLRSLGISDLLAKTLREDTGIVRVMGTTI